MIRVFCPLSMKGFQKQKHFVSRWVGGVSCIHFFGDFFYICLTLCKAPVGEFLK